METAGKKKRSFKKDRRVVQWVKISEMSGNEWYEWQRMTASNKKMLMSDSE